MRIANNAQEGKITAGVYLYKNKKGAYDKLFESKAAIEQDLGYTLTWENDPKKQTAVLKIERPADIENNARWKEEHEWLRQKLESLDRVFRPLVKSVV